MANIDISKILHDNIQAISVEKDTTPVIKTPDVPYTNRYLQSYDKFNNEEDKKDQQSNRTLRERITPQIFWMMVIELVFIAGLIISLVSVPFINALGPVIKISLPPIIKISSLIVGFIYIFYNLKKYPDDKEFKIFQSDGFRIPCKYKRKTKIFNIFKFEINIHIRFLKIVTIGTCMLLINLFSRSDHIFTINDIYLSNETLKIIMLIIETIFVKTTLLAGFIIHGLFKTTPNK